MQEDIKRPFHGLHQWGMQRTCPIPFRNKALKPLQELCDSFWITDFRREGGKSFITLGVHLKNDHSNNTHSWRMNTFTFDNSSLVHRKLSAVHLCRDDSQCCVLGFLVYFQKSLPSRARGRNRFARVKHQEMFLTTAKGFKNKLLSSEWAAGCQMFSQCCYCCERLSRGQASRLPPPGRCLLFTE